jgi:hypothetical protein
MFAPAIWGWHLDDDDDDDDERFPWSWVLDLVLMG